MHIVTIFAMMFGRRVIACNSEAGVHQGGRVTRTAIAPITTRFLIVKQSGTGLGIDLCGATDKPIGFATDEATDAGDTLNVVMGGSAETTQKAIASVAVAAGDTLYTAVGGQVTNVPVAGCYLIGNSMQAGAIGDAIEIDPAGFGVPYKA